MGFSNILKKIRKFYMKYIFKIFVMSILIIGFFIMAGFFLNLLIGLEYPLSNDLIGDYNNWISFYGNVLGGFLGVVIALYIFHQKDRKSKEDKTEKLKIYKYHLCNNLLSLTEKDVKVFKMRIENKIESKRLNPHEDYLFNLKFEINYEKVSELEYYQLSDNNFITLLYGLEHNIKRFNNELEKFKDEYDIKREEYLRRKSELSEKCVKTERYTENFQSLLIKRYEDLKELLDTIHYILIDLDVYY